MFYRLTVAFLLLFGVFSVGVVEGQIDTAGELFVDLDASDPTAGTAIWTNNGTLGDFVEVGDPVAEVIGGVPAVTFNSTEVLDAYQQPEEMAPAGLVGVDPTRSVEAWVYNPTVSVDETIVAWGYRGGPNGSNMGLQYGTHTGWGAVQHWGTPDTSDAGPDMGWGTLPAPGQWHHLVYTYDGSTTRAYADGVLANSEDLGAGVVDTHVEGKITLGAQINSVAGDLLAGTRGTLSIARLRVHDEVLTPEQVADNYGLEADDFSGLPFFNVIPEGATIFDTVPLYRGTFSVSGIPVPSVTLVAPTPGDAELTETSPLVYEIDVPVPQPPPASFDVSIELTNDFGTVTDGWTVNLVPAPPCPVPGIACAGELFVSLDASDLPLGPAPESWPNGGSLGDFTRFGEPTVEEVGGVKAVRLNSAGDSDVYRQSGAEAAPDGLVGVDATRSIEVWVFNPSTLDDEPIVAWGYRGGPDGSNMSFGYGGHPVWGAVQHWGAADTGWVTLPALGQWHHLVYTYDGTTTRQYVDGVLDLEEVLGSGVINTWGGTKITVGNQIANAEDLLSDDPLIGPSRLSIARLRIHDEALTAEQVESNFNEEVTDFSGPPFFSEIPDGHNILDTDESYEARFAVSGIPEPAVTVIEPVGADLVETSPLRYQLTYAIPSPPPDSFTVTIELTNDFGTIQGSWTVSVIAPVCPLELFCAGELLVYLDSEDLPESGTAPEFWPNRGTMSDFLRVGSPMIEEFAGSHGVTFNEAGLRNGYVSQENAPDSITGPDPTCTIEAWVLNEIITDEEAIVAWGQRGGPDGTLQSFRYSTNGTWGAVGHWGAANETGWINLPEASQWHHLAYTYDGAAMRTFADGVEDNFVELGAGALNTHPNTKITIARETTEDGVTLEPALVGELTVAVVRLHSEVLDGEEISANYFTELDRFTPVQFAPRALFLPQEGQRHVYLGTTEYAAEVFVEAFPADILLEMQEPPGATIDTVPTASPGQLIGTILAPVPDPSEEGSFEVVLLASNSVDVTEFRWTVEVRGLPEPGSGVQTAGDLIVDLDASDPSAGTAVWMNRASGPNSVGNFNGIANSGPRVETIDGIRAVTMNDSNVRFDVYESELGTPAGIVGHNPTTTVEVWAYNPAIGGQESVLSWGRSGVPDGSNATYGYGTGGAGAIQRWGGADMGWGAAPPAGAWHHLVYTYDGTTQRAYADGVEANSEQPGFGAINVLGADLPINIGAHREQDETGFVIGARFSGSIAKVRVHDGVLQPEQIVHNYQEDLAGFTGGGGGFKRGDVNANGTLDIGDPTNNLSHQFLGFAVPCRDALDYNDDGIINISDPISNLTHQFLGGPPPALPGKESCGPDPTDDDLECESYPPESC